MFAAPDLFFVKFPDFFRTTTFRWTSVAFAVCILLFSAFVYLEAAATMRASMDANITDESLIVAADTQGRPVGPQASRLRPRRTPKPRGTGGQHADPAGGGIGRAVGAA